MPIKLDLWDYTRFKKSIPHASNYPVISNVQISVSGLVTWTTDIASTSQVLYGFVPYLGFSTVYDSTLTTSHSVQIPNIIPAFYYLKVQSFYLDALSISDLYTFSLSSTFGIYTVTNLTPTITYDADLTSIDELANVLGSLITLFQGGSTITSGFTATNVTTDRSFDETNTSIDEIADVMGTIIADLSATGTSTNVYTVINPTSDYTLDCTNTSVDELANVLGSIISSLQGAGKLQ